LLEVRGNNYDVVYLSFYWVAMLFIRKIRRRLPSAIIYVDSHDIHFLRTRREADLHKDRAHRQRAEQTKVDELGVYARADAVLTVTELDRQTLLKELPGATVFLMPNAHDVVPVEQGYPERKDLLFVGGFNHTPNVDAMLYFCREIFPKVKECIPGIKLWIVGSNPTEEVKALADDSVTVTGWVKDTRPYLDKCRVSIAPLRYGAGMKGKVGEAMCHGLPVITTSVGSEGMGIIDGKHALVADGINAWVEQIVRLYNDEELWKRLSANGQELMSERYGSDAMLKRAQHILEFRSRQEIANQSPLPAARRKPSDDVSVSIIIVTYNQV
jgi:glycosyltransferase involved in cell wall biosynthesis